MRGKTAKESILTRMYASQPSDEGLHKPSAFRVAEKHYQLHKEQVLRRRNGRTRGGQLVARPTDLSDVVELHEARSAAAWCAKGVAVHHALPWPPQWAESEDAAGNAHGGSSPRTQPVLAAFTFPSHPGLLLLPNALPMAQQLRLVRAALEVYPDPPATTNHTKHLGHLPGLWRAAQAGLLLRAPPAPSTLSSQAGDTRQQAAEQIQQSDTCRTGGLGACAHENGTGSSRSCNSQGSSRRSSCSSHMVSEDGWEGSTPWPNFESVWAPGTATAATLASKQPHERTSATHSQPSQPTSQPPVHIAAQPCQLSQPAATGPPAASLLRKLRWATLGPQYDWSARKYALEGVHRPLPACLQHLAMQAAELVDMARQQLSFSQVQGAMSDSSGGASSNGAWGHGTQPFQPDAALVNYYYEGDTLGGHIDDVEPDQAAPIVSVSLGCDAVFLMGGHTRDTPPTAIRLRSGDIVVLGGAARCSYHGVPRVFPATDACPLPAGLRPEDHTPSLDDSQGCLPGGYEGGSGLLPFVQHMQACRINISIRAVR